MGLGLQVYLKAGLGRDLLPFHSRDCLSASVHHHMVLAHVPWLTPERGIQESLREYQGEKPQSFHKPHLKSDITSAIVTSLEASHQIQLTLQGTEFTGCECQEVG